jgi:hypothetical protein
MATQSFKNITDGPKVLNSTPIVILQAGQETDGPVEITDAESDSAILSEWFEIVKTSKPGKSSAE